MRARFKRPVSLNCVHGSFLCYYANAAPTMFAFCRAWSFRLSLGFVPKCWRRCDQQAQLEVRSARAAGAQCRESLHVLQVLGCWMPG